MNLKKEVMPQSKETKFVLDREFKKQQEVIAKILEVVKKKPYPTREATHLATFIHSLFQTAPFLKHPKLKKKMEKKSKELEKKKLEEKEELHGFAKPKPLPKAPAPHRVKVEPEKKKFFSLPKLKKKEFRRREYVVNLFNTPVGVYVAPDEKTKRIIYRVIEPVINEKVLDLTKDYIEKDFKKDRKVLDDDELLKEKVEKAAKKSDIKFTEDYPKKIKYYLKRDLSGFRRIDPMMQDGNVKSIYVYGTNKPVEVEFEGVPGKIQSNVVFSDSNDLNVLITKLGKIAGKEVTDENPILDTMFHGFRIQATKGVGGASSKLAIIKVM